MKLVKTYKKLSVVFIIILLVIVALLVWKEIQEINNRKKEQAKGFADDLKRIQDKGVLKAAVDYNSTNYFIYRGKPMGFEYELLQAYCKEIGVDLEIVVSNNLNDAFEGLKTGRFDVIARNVTITIDRREEVDFTEPIYQTKQVLVQKERKSVNDSNYVTSALQLVGKRVTIQKNSAHQKRLVNLAEEIGGAIRIETDSLLGAEDLIARVAKGEIEYTVCDENIGFVNKYYYPLIDISVPVSLEQNIAWAVRKGAVDLKSSIDSWFIAFKSTRKFNHLYYKYFESPRALERKESDFHSLTGGRISKFDATIKEVSKKFGWDWRLIAAMIYHESRFNENAAAWTGAYGLMQLMPSTAEAFGITNITIPKQNITGGVMLLNSLNNQFIESIPDSSERVKFVLAAYNVGLGHVKDAQQLAEKYGKNPKLWNNNVKDFLENKAEEKYFKDPVVRWGYCRGTDATQFVDNVVSLYNNYRNIIAE